MSVYYSSLLLPLLKAEFTKLNTKVTMNIIVLKDHRVENDAFNAIKMSFKCSLHLVRVIVAIYGTLRIIRG